MGGAVNEARKADLAAGTGHVGMRWTLQCVGLELDCRLANHSKNELSSSSAVSSVPRGGGPQCRAEEVLRGPLDPDVVANEGMKSGFRAPDST